MKPKSKKTARPHGRSYGWQIVNGRRVNKNRWQFVVLSKRGLKGK